MVCVAPGLERFSLKGNLPKYLFYLSLENNGKRDFVPSYECLKTHFGNTSLYSFNHLVTLQVNDLCLEFDILDLNKGQCFERSQVL